MVISSSASSGSSLRLAPQEGEVLETKSKVPPLEFQEIAKSLTAGKSPKMEIDSPQTRTAQQLQPW